MTPFKVLGRSTNRRDRMLALACGGIAFLVYVLTLCPGAFPGTSAELIAVYSGIEPQVAPVHPLWALIVGGLSRLSVLSLPVRLNLFSALCASLSVMLMYRFMAFFVRQTVHDESIGDRQMDFAAVLAGLSAAAAFAFCVPVWSSAVRLQYQSFDVLCLLAVCYLVVLYASTDRLLLLPLFALLYGVGICEATIFMTAAPAAALAVLLVLWKRDHLSHQTISLMMALTLLGLGAYVLCAWQFYHHEDVSLRGYGTWLDVLVFMWRDQYHEIQRAIPRLNWIWLFFQSILPATAAAVAARRALNNERSWSFYLLHIILTAISVCVLANLWFTPWREIRGSGALPVATYALMALTVGYLVAYWFLLMRVRSVRHDQHISNLTKRAGDWMGLVLAWPLVAVVAVAAVINGFEANGHRGDGADLCARQILDRMRQAGHTWLITDGTLDNHLSILARERGQTIRLLCLQKDTDRIYQRRLIKAIEQDGLFKADRKRMLASLDLGVLPFLQDWFAGDPAGVAKQVAVFGVPDFWYGATLLPFPNQLFFSGVPNYDRLDGKTLAADSLAFLKRMDGLLPRRPRSNDPTALFGNNLRRHLGFVANDLGVVLEQMACTNEAAAIYTRVREFDPDNISALFNLFEMARRGNDPRQRDDIEKQLRDFIARQPQQYPLWSLSRYFGYVRSPELFVRLGWNWALSGQYGAAIWGIRQARDLVVQNAQSRAALDAIMASILQLHGERAKSEEIYRQMLEQNPQNREALREMAKAAVLTGAFDKARDWLDKLQQTGVSANQLGVERAAISLAAGQYADARLHLQLTLDVQPNNLQAWGMLAVVLLQMAESDRTAKKDPAPYLKEVEQTVLPKMESIAGTPDQYFVQIVRAQLAMTRGKEYLRVAREAFIRASILRPDVPKLNDVILQLDIALADQPRAEQHARQVLRIDRNHALANYVMGSLRLQSGQSGDAEYYLRRSVATEPLPAALNDLAETLRRIRKTAEAENYAREAIKKSPELYTAWETLASILMDQNRLDESEAALNKAVEMNREDMRIRVSLARLQCLRGDLDRARETLKVVRTHQADLSPFELDELEKVAKLAERRR